MSTGAIVMMVVGIGIIWGALLLSVVHAVRTHRAASGDGEVPPRPDL
ncbi:MAG TPA: methionine/alanine import family NSS transporter small subunit [Egibacteraceae bacterium]